MKKNKSIFSLLFIVLTMAITACEKTVVDFGETTSLDDPNITYFENYHTVLETIEADSFITSSHRTFVVGHHTDPAIGTTDAGSYVEISYPTNNPLLNQKVIFDSLELIVRPTGSVYGDSSQQFTIKVHRLTELIDGGDAEDNFYNTTFFPFEEEALGEKIFNLSGSAGKELHIRLKDELGKELLEKFREGHYDVSSPEAFRDYLKGLYIGTDSMSTNSLLYLSAPDSMLLNLNYHVDGLVEEKGILSFGFNYLRQFSNIRFKKASASLLENKALLLSTAGTSIKISFPSLLEVKELSPYTRIVKALLIIKPEKQSFTFPYSLPSQLNLYTTDDSNIPLEGFYNNSTTDPQLLTGDLIQDPIYGENTYYSYDITNFINKKIAEGQFSNSSILLRIADPSFDLGINRLILDQQIANSIQLKLYVLEL